jgi:predicted HTH domain antitoxin
MSDKEVIELLCSTDTTMSDQDVIDLFDSTNITLARLAWISNRSKEELKKLLMPQ